MGVIMSSCAHRTARLYFLDKVVNLVLGLTLPLAGLAEAGISEEDRLKRLESVRRRGKTISNFPYRSLIKAKWTAEECELPLISGQGTIKVVLHKPICVLKSPSDVPLIIWAHGGGLNIMDCYDSWGAALFSDITQVGPSFCWASVDYQLAPEAKFPLAVQDIVSVFNWFADPTISRFHGYSLNRIGIAGVSAGAFLAAHASRVLNQTEVFSRTGLRPAFLACLFPMVDPHMKYPSHSLYDDLPACPGSWLRCSWSWLLANSSADKLSEERVLEASLLCKDWSELAKSSLPTLLVLGKYDILYDEGVAFGDLLAQAGVPVERIVGDGTHAVANLADAKAKAKILSWWRHALGPLNS